jgi:hypothetical protein
LTIQDRLKSFISPEPNSGCWLWIGFTNSKGYGHIWYGGRMRLAHRVSWEIERGSVQDGLCLDHLCRVRCCVNPDHLEPVTIQENIRRGDTGINHRSKTHCPQGHEYTENNTYKQSHSAGQIGGGGRICRECQRAYHRKYGPIRRAKAKATPEKNP